MSQIWQGLLSGLTTILQSLHDTIEPVVGRYSWGWAIVLLTLTVRLVLLPLAIKQTTSMRAMQKLQPEIKRIQAKYKADRGLMKTDPERYRELRDEQQQQMMALYKQHNVNPAAGCLPLVAQMPIFFALYNVLRSDIPGLADAPFYLVTRLSLTVSTGAGIGAILLLVLMAASTFLSQRQTMASNPALADNQQQKILLYVMPAMLTFFGLNLPIGVLLYWVTTNIWTMSQQYVLFRTLGRTPATAGAAAALAPAPVSVQKSGGTRPPVRVAKKDRAGAAEAVVAPAVAAAGKGAPTPSRKAANQARLEAASVDASAGRGSGRGGGSSGGSRGNARGGQQQRRPAGRGGSKRT